MAHLNVLAANLFLAASLFAAAFATAPAAVAQAPARSAAPPGGDAVIAWNRTASMAATQVGLAPLGPPFPESRMYAMMHIAIHDALNAIDRRYLPYSFDRRAERGASPEAAVAAAARDVLVPLLGQLPRQAFPQARIDASVAGVEAAYRAALDAIPDAPARAQGVAVGQEAAAAILALRASDGAVGPFINTNCPQNPAPGRFQCVPGLPFIAFQGWAKVTPFVLQDSEQFRPGPPHALTARAYTADFHEVKSLGGNGDSTPSGRSPDQTEIALFWLESSPLKWSRIARAVSVTTGLDLWQNARLFGLLNMALADGYIAMTATKNHYDYWRPVTAIRAADTDGNPETTANPAWTPLGETPPTSDYASGHAIEGGAGAEVLKQFFGTDRIGFRDCGTTLPAGSTCGDPSPVFRSYATFSQAADENAYSRILIGFHFRKSIEEGTEYGRRIGERAVARFLQPATAN
ncbi:MAG: vanadium-dependent haloperoxidase [Acetobacteraceae bacterium]|nr:vanadium-dependent haloperoxidase [Acetobacteraceae bacterium]